MGAGPTRGNLVQYNATYWYVCSCGAVNRGSISLHAVTERAAIEKASATSFTCSACRSTSPRESIKIEIRLLSF